MQQFISMSYFVDWGNTFQHETGLSLIQTVCFPCMFSVHYVENISSELRYALLFSFHMWETYEIEPALFLMLFSISFGQSEESSNEVNCFFTDNAKILISDRALLL